jgi:hypothetical protein
VSPPSAISYQLSVVRSERRQGINAVLIADSCRLAADGWQLIADGTFPRPRP